MAAPAPEPPQTIVLGSFNGVRNTIARQRLQPSDLATAVNVDIDDAGQVRRRRGRTKVASGDFHSLKQIAGRHLVVRDGILGRVSRDYAFTPFGPVSGKLRYVAVGSTVYIASDSASYKLVGDDLLPWGGRDQDHRWVSPVMQPTETLGAVAGRMLAAPPHAAHLEHYKGRIYLAAGRVLWATELYNYELVDKNRNYVVLDDDITMLAAVGDGIYVGTETQLLFLGGIFAKGLERVVVMDAPVVPGSCVQVPYSKAHPQARQGNVPEGYGPMFMTEAGVCLGLDGGQVFNLTQERVVFPGMVAAAALYREDQGANSYVAVADSGGTPSANARIGDYVDAEIIRRGG